MEVPPASKPKIQPTTILFLGFVIYGLSALWSPSLLVITFLLSYSIPHIFRINDNGGSRRTLWNSWALEEERPEEWKPKNISKNMILKEDYWINKRGMVLSTSTMMPKSGESKAVVCLCHGFNDNASYYKRIGYQRLIRKGIAVVTIEYEGHGRSDGLLSYIPSWEHLIDDTTQFFQQVLQEKFSGKKCFLMGESMGGAISYFTYERNPKLWSGVVFVAPMLKVAKGILPPPWVVILLQKLLGPSGSYSPIGWLPIAPTANIAQKAFRLPEKYVAVCKFPCFYGRQPRLATARELLNVMTHISENYKNFIAPFIILHGKDDMVTCPDLSQMFHDDSKSPDKEIKLYPGLWHNLTCGETEKDMDMVFNDAIHWILARI